MVADSVAADWRQQLPGVSTAELTQRIHDVLSGQRFAFMLPRIVVLDDDVDASDVGELMWAMTTRVHPTGRRIVRNGKVLPLVACYTPEERHSWTGDHVTYDALLPAVDEGREPRSSFRHIFPAEVQQHVLAHWTH